MFAVEEITQASQDESGNGYENNDRGVARAPIFWSNLAGLIVRAAGIGGWSVLYRHWHVKILNVLWKSTLSLKDSYIYIYI